jgi:hypothetical protein
MINICANCAKEFEAKRRTRKYCSYSCSNKVNAKLRESEKLKDKPVTVWSCGGGVQSTVMAALIIQGRIPKPDLSLMTDCGYEQEQTMSYVHNVLIPELKKAGVELNIIKTTDYSNNDITDKRGFITIPLYKDDNGKAVKYPTRCNSSFKVRPAMNWIREQGVNHCENWLGISTDEYKRARPGSRRWVKLRYPLIEMGISREDCMTIIANHGWPKPPRSNCYFCPQQNNESWVNMKVNHPADWHKAIQVEKELQKMDPAVYLHRSMVPLEEVAFDEVLYNILIARGRGGQNL